MGMGQRSGARKVPEQTSTKGNKVRKGKDNVVYPAVHSNGNTISNK